MPAPISLSTRIICIICIMCIICIKAIDGDGFCWQAQKVTAKPSTSSCLARASSLFLTTCSGIFLSAASSNPTLFVRRPAQVRKSGAPSGRRLWRSTTYPVLVSSWPADGKSIWICEQGGLPVVLELRGRLASPRWSWTRRRGLQAWPQAPGGLMTRTQHWQA